MRATAQVGGGHGRSRDGRWVEPKCSQGVAFLWNGGRGREGVGGRDKEARMLGFKLDMQL